MKKNILAVLILFFCSIIVNGQVIPIPENYLIIDSVSGDLDKDGKNELVVVCDTKKKEDENESVPRELIIYKFNDGKLIPWRTSGQAIYGSRDGGMMGDPFGDIEIRNGILLISQNGGSSWKWAHTDSYRYQNGEFYLIGYTSNYGKLCEYWTNVDFNLSTGKMIVRKEYEDCERSEQGIYKRENETIYRKGIKITIGNRNEKEVKLVTPKYKHEVYIAIRIE